MITISLFATLDTENNLPCLTLPSQHNLIAGGESMNACDYWSLFIETGAPELYLSYKRAQESEGTNVFNGAGAGTAGNSIQ